MDSVMVIELGREAIATMLLLMTPPMVVALVVGLAIAIMQAATQVQEMTLTFVPKIIAVFLSVAVFGSWMANVMVTFTRHLLTDFPALIR